MFPALPEGFPIPAAPKAYIASYFISSRVGIAGSSLPLRAIQWGWMGWAQIKGRGTQWSIGHRNVLENERIQQAFNQTALLLYFARPSLFREIPFLAGKQRKTANIFLLLLLLQITGWCRLVQHPNIRACIWIMCIVHLAIQSSELIFKKKSQIWSQYRKLDLSALI